MKKESISEMTPEECSDELVMKSIKKLLQKARKKSKESDEALQAVYQAIDDMCIDLDVHSDAENADTLEEAINCYVQYGEYNLTDLLKEIRQQYVER
jgi:hypothetical protein